MILYESEIEKLALEQLRDKKEPSLPCEAAAHHRRSIRLRGYDYRQAGAYFITICTQDREHRFGEIVNGEMVLSDLGRIAQDQWEKIPARFDQVELDAFMVMPNHFHGIIIINDPGAVGAGFTPAHDVQPRGAEEGAGASPARTTIRETVGDIVGAYKSLVANECLKVFKSRDETMGKIWQRNYYEHIIRNEEAYLKIAQYIFDNPAQWEVDSLNPGNMP